MLVRRVENIEDISTWCDFMDWLIEIQKNTESIEMETLILDAQDELFDLLRIKWNR